MQDQKIYMTPGCAARMRAELKDLLYVKRPEMVNTVAWAASNGDRSLDDQVSFQSPGVRRDTQKRVPL